MNDFSINNCYEGTRSGGLTDFSAKRASRVVKFATSSCMAVLMLASFGVAQAQDITTMSEAELDAYLAQQQQQAYTDEDGVRRTADDKVLLDQVVVTATGFEQNVVDAPASISVISREQIEKGSFHDLGDALRNVQGVAVTGTANEQDIFIRGLPGSYTLILVDGKRQSTRETRTNGNSGYEQSFIPPAAAIERIEVVRGPMSSLYGSDAMGGVINIITRKVPTKWTGSLTVDGTMNQHSEYGNTLQGSYYVAGPIVENVMGLQIWGRGLGREEDEIHEGTPKKKEIDITGRVTITPNEDHDIVLEAGHTRLRRYNTLGNVVLPTDRFPYSQYNVNDRDHYSAAYTGRFGWTTAEISIMQETAQRTNYNYSQTENRYIENLRSPEIRNTIVDAKFTTPFSMMGDHTLVTGGQFNKATLTDQNPGMNSTLNEEFSVEQWALFAEDEWWLNNDFALTGGLRMDHHQMYGEHFSPRLYAVWHATEQLSVKGGVSTGFRAPDIRSISPNYAYTTNGGRGVIVGDGNLEAEKSVSYELSTIWDNMAGLQLGATYFYTDFKDKVSNRQVMDANDRPVYWQNRNGDNYLLYEYLNIDKAVMQGVELTAQWEATQSLVFRANYTYTDSEQKSGDYDGLPLARTPEHMANIRADWNTPVEGLESWASANYHGEETNAGFRTGTAGEPVYKDGAIVGRKYGDYFTFDIGGSYAFNENVRLNAAVYNLFDKRVDVDTFNDVVEGRRFWLSMTSTF